jgi:hypothetical protein
MHKIIDLLDIKTRYNQALNSFDRRVVICAGTGCIANNSLKVHKRLFLPGDLTFHSN